MSLIAPLSSATAVVLAGLFVKLAFAVIRKRRLHKVVLGSGQYSDLESAIRAHGNFAEYVPLSLLLILCAEINQVTWWLVAPAAAALVVGRYIHAMAIPANNLKMRVRGMQWTFASLAGGMFANVAALAKAFIQG